jgi:hypothetical protein
MKSRKDGPSPRSRITYLIMEGTTVSLLTGLAYFAHAQGRLLVVAVAKVTGQTQHTIPLSQVPSQQVKLLYV